MVKEFLKGEPVLAFEPGKTYVVEFWATWCGPCLATIPHLTDLQKKYKDITFIGVSIWEDEPKEVAPFVKEMGDKMDATSPSMPIPDGAKTRGRRWPTWMDAAGEEGIPRPSSSTARGRSPGSATRC
ncbi:MAG: TlpA disulfide reductase family protein [Isosphaeraceae bacterium]